MVLRQPMSADLHGVCLGFTGLLQSSTCVCTYLGRVLALLPTGCLCSLRKLRCTAPQAVLVFWTSSLIASYPVFGANVYAVNGVAFSCTMSFLTLTGFAATKYCQVACHAGCVCTLCTTCDLLCIVVLSRHNRTIAYSSCYC